MVKKPEKADKRHSGFEKATRKLTSGAPKDRLYGESLDDLSEEEFEQLDELYKDPDKHFSKQSKPMQDAINLHQRKGKSYWEAVRAAKSHVKEETETQEVEQQLDESVTKYANFLARTKQ